MRGPLIGGGDVELRGAPTWVSCFTCFFSSGEFSPLPEKIEWKSINWDGYGTRTFTRIKKVTSLGSIPISDSVGLEEAKAKLTELYVERYGLVT